MKCCAIVIAVIKDIVNTCIAEIGTALGIKQGSILGIALETGLSTALGIEPLSLHRQHHPSF
jgi:hypothetical protein